MNLELSLYNLKIPLRKPYHLAFKTVHDFDSIVICLEKEDGSLFWGEVTALLGYSWESGEEILQTVKRWILSAGNSLSKLISLVLRDQRANPFAATPLLSAIEKMSATPVMTPVRPIPLVGIISTGDPARIEAQTGELLDLCYSTIKIKVKGDAKNDLERLRLLQSLVKKNTSIRIDANQSYTFEEMTKFINRVNPENIEYFEQPFKPEAWGDMKRLAPISPFPLMLDESIWTEDDIANTAGLGCAGYVKLKMAKHSSMKKTIELAGFAGDNGLRVILGNGVQTEIGCVDEARIYQECGLDTVAEMNGFLKQTESVLEKPLKFEDGKLSITETPTVNPDKIEKFCVQQNKTVLRDDTKDKEREPWTE